jgi:predicted Zn-dependent protease
MSQLFFKLFIIVMVPFFMAACTTSPTSGKKIFTGLVSEQQEQGIGAQEHQKIVRRYGGVNDSQELNLYVAKIGARLAPHAERRGLRWTFTVLDDDLVNAFAVPGGYIYITRGLLALAQDESQVAGVLAHEMGHVNARHTAQQMSQGMLANIGLQALSIATGSSLAGQLGSTGADLYLKSYSRAHEFEADALSIKYLSAAGYDHFATKKFLQQLQRSTEFEARMQDQAAGQELFGYFSTHPQTPDRIVRADTLAQEVTTSQNAIIDRASYLRAINGTVYGDSGSKGFIKGRDFIHPKLKIRFTAPSGFTLKNTDKAVIARDQKNALMLFDVVRSDTEDAASYIGARWAAQVQLTGQERIEVNGLSGATAATTTQLSNSMMDIRMVALNAGEGRFYRLLFATPQGAMVSYAEAFRRATYSFEKSDAIASFSPARVKVITVRSGDTVQSLSARMQVADFPLERFCLLNDVTPDQKLALGEQVKIVE